MFATGAVSSQAGSVLIEHRGSVPRVHTSAYVAPMAVICGAVRIGPDTRVLFGAVLTAEDGRVSVGVTRDAPASERMSRQSAWFAAHRRDRILDEGPPRGDD